jgi:hypothetical protein
MPRFYEPDLGADPDSPFARDASNKLVRRSYWLDMNDRTLVVVMVNGIGAHLTNDEKRAHWSPNGCIKVGHRSLFRGSLLSVNATSFSNCAVNYPWYRLIWPPARKSFRIDFPL